MPKTKRVAAAGAAAMAIAAVPMAAQGRVTDPEHLRTPAVVTCIDLTDTIASSDKSGIMYTWDTRLERGAYYAEHEDDDGTFFRGPPGAVYRGVRGAENKQPGLVTHLAREGGLYVPRDPAKPPLPYIYSSASSVDIPQQHQIPGSSCATIAYVRDSAQHVVGIVAADSGKSVVLPLKVDSQGGETTESSEATPRGGLIELAILAAAVHMNEGKITTGTIPLDDAALATLKAIVTHPRPIDGYARDKTSPAQ